jgi:transcription elongation factor Elf1
MATIPAGASTPSPSNLQPPPSTGDRRRLDVGPPRRTRERRVRHRTPSGLTATDGLKMACPCCGASESAVAKTSGELTCPQCGHVQSDVVKVKGLIDVDAIRRRRECAGCGFRFPTMEAVDLERLEAELNARGISIADYVTNS